MFLSIAVTIFETIGCRCVFSLCFVQYVCLVCSYAVEPLLWDTSIQGTQSEFGPGKTST